MSKPTRDEIKAAFMAIMDGTDEHDLRAQTGLPEERCHEIFEVYQKLLREDAQCTSSTTN